MNSSDVTMTSYCLYNIIVINLADVSRFSNSVLNLEEVTKEFEFPKNVLFVSFHQLNGKLWLILYFFIVTTFQIWACHVTCVYKLAKSFISRDTLLNFRKIHQI